MSQVASCKALSPVSRVSAFQRLSECLLAAAGRRRRPPPPFLFVLIFLTPSFPPEILALFMTGVTGRSSHDFPGHVHIVPDKFRLWLLRQTG